MCSACSGNYENPEVTVDTGNESECPHAQVIWNGYRGLFVCKECGAQLVMEELAEALGLVPTE